MLEVSSDRPTADIIVTAVMDGHKKMTRSTLEGNYDRQVFFFFVLLPFLLFLKVLESPEENQNLPKHEGQSLMMAGLQRELRRAQKILHQPTPHPLLVLK